MNPSPFKSHGGLRRVLDAARYSWAGLRAAVRHEAAFRQELALGLPMIVAAPFLAPSRWAALAMIASVMCVWVVELLNSAIEAIVDLASPEQHALAERAKDLGSAAVFAALATVVVTWGLVLG